MSRLAAGLSCLAVFGIAVGASAQGAGSQGPPGETLDAAAFVAKYGAQPNQAGPGQAGAPADKAQNPDDLARRGIALIYQAGQPIAMGAVLAGDGRVVTALSPLGTGNNLEIKLADGSSVPVKVGHHDRAWDLALLVPQRGRWQHGLAASGADPLRQGAIIKSFTSVAGKPSIAPVQLNGYRDLIGGDDEPLQGAIEIGSRVATRDLGAPLVENGAVVGVISRACMPNQGDGCTPVAYGVPMKAIREFLKTTPPDAVPPSAWLGIQGVREDGDVAKGVRVLVVHPGSPAEAAGLKGGNEGQADVILAIAGAPVTSPDGLSKAIKQHGPGEKVPMTVLSAGKYRTVEVTLGSAPPKGQSGGTAPAKHPAQLPPKAN